MIRNIIALVVGLALGMVVNLALVSLNMSLLHPMPAGSSMSDPVQFQAYLDTLPATAFLVAVLAHLGQAFVGGWVAARLCTTRPVVFAMIIGAISLAGGISMMATYKGPDWMFIELPLYLVVAWLAGRCEQNRRARLSA